MAKQAELYDGTVLEFPDDTPDDVIGKTAASETARIRGTKEKAEATASPAAPPTPAEAPAPGPAPGPAPAPQGRGRRGTNRNVTPFVGGDQQFDPGRGKIIPPMVGEGARPGESVLDVAGRPRLNDDYVPQRDYEADSVAPRVQADQAARGAYLRPSGNLSQTPIGERIGSDVRRGLNSTLGSGGAAVAGGVVSGLGELAKTGTGAVQAAADVAGLNGVADFASASSKTAAGISKAVEPQGEGIDKKISEVFSSITGSLPFMVTGTAGENAAFKLMFGQTALADYADRRAQGVQPLPAAITSTVTGAAEVLGEKFGFREQTLAVKNLMDRMARHGSSSDDMAKNAVKLLLKEVPGEELTTAIEFLNDKYNIGGLTPDATLEAYFKQAIDTAVTTMGQAAVIGGTPAALNKRGNVYKRAEEAIDQSAGLLPAGPYREAAKAGFVVTPPLVTDTPLEQRNKVVGIFEAVAAQHGVSPEAVKRAKEASATMPAEQVGPFFRDMLDALQRKGGVATAISPVTSATLTAGAVAPPEEETKEVAKPAPAPAPVESKPVESGATTPAIDSEPTKSGSEPLESGTTAVSRETKLVRTDEGWKVAPVDEAAHAAATSPQNDLPEPTPAQALAGNYAKGHAKIGGLDISIENPEGSTRRDKNNDPPKWETTMRQHYGYIRGTVGQDGEHIDTFIEPGTAPDYSGNVFVVDQTHEDGTPDEHKVMIGFDTIQDAKKAYLSNYAKGWKGLGNITATTMDGFKTWLKDGDTTKPFAPTHEPAQPDVRPAAQLAPEPAAARGDQPARGGRAVGPVADVLPGAAPAAPARPVARSAQPAAPVRNSGNGTASVARTIGRAGTTPNTATPIELRANKDGTVTPWHDGHELLDFDSAEPVKIPAEASDREALDAIKAAGAFGRRTKVFQDKAEPTEETAPAGTPDAAAVSGDVPASSAVAKPEAKRGRSASRTAKARMAFNPETDTVLQALAKMGGLERQAVAKEFGLKPEEMRHQVRAGNLNAYPFRVNGGMSIDGAITALQEAGYFAGVAADDVRRALEDAIHSELGGAQVLTPQGQAKRAADMFDEREAAERDTLLDEAALSEAEMAALDDDDIDLDAKSNTSTEAFMRSMGFSEKEIADETAKQARDAQASAAEDRPAAGTTTGEADGAGGGQTRLGVAEERAGIDRGNADRDLSDAEAFAGDYAALEGKTLEQTVRVADTDQTAVLKFDAARALRTLDAREKALKGLLDCLTKKAA